MSEKRDAQSEHLESEQSKSPSGVETAQPGEEAGEGGSAKDGGERRRRDVLIKDDGKVGRGL